jgi:hypothetical protein
MAFWKASISIALVWTLSAVRPRDDVPFGYFEWTYDRRHNSPRRTAQPALSQACSYLPRSVPTHTWNLVWHQSQSIHPDSPSSIPIRPPSTSRYFPLPLPLRLSDSLRRSRSDVRGITLPLGRLGPAVGAGADADVEGPGPALDDFAMVQWSVARPSSSTGGKRAASF